MNDDEYVAKCSSLRIVVHGCDWETESNDQARFKIEGHDDTYWIDDFEILQNTILHELDRWYNKWSSEFVHKDEKQ